MENNRENYVLATQASEETGYSKRRILQLCQEGKVPGALLEGGNWMIPESSLSKIARIRKPLPVGISDFKKASSEFCYVDKTMLIKDILDSRPQAILFTRPRRFGKTLNMDMLKAYFEKTEEDTSVYFKDKAIWEAGEKYREEQGRYPVVFLTFKDLKFHSWEETFASLRRIIRDEFDRHAELRTSNELSPYEREKYNSFFMKENSMDSSLFASSLSVLSDLLYKHHGVKPIIIVDEYDAPIHNAHAEGYYEEAISFLRAFFSMALKDSQNISYAFLTGVMRIAKESLFSGLNNLKIDSVMDDRYSPYFGLSGKEVKALLSSYGKKGKLKEALSWYDGYLFGENRLFNPWSIMNYLDDGCSSPKPYWTNTADNSLLGEILSSSGRQTLDELASLMRGEPIFSRPNIDLSYPKIAKNPSAVYGFLLATGYLTLKEKPKAKDEGYVWLSIPNKEVECAYRSEILDKYESIIPSSSSSFIEASILRKDVKGIEEGLRELLRSSISYNDASSESFYHGLTLGLCATMNDSYLLYSNRESGEGRFDIYMEPKQKGLPAILIEVKSSKKASEDALDGLSKAALSQMEGKDYAREAKRKGIEDILKLGIAYSGKSVRVASNKD